MSSTFINLGVLLLAQKRLRDFVGGMTRKSVIPTFETDHFHNTATVVVNEQDRQMLAMARDALAAFDVGPRITLPSRAVIGREIAPGRDIGQYAVLGSIGLDLLRYLNTFHPSRGWSSPTLGGAPGCRR
jgi:hypothetical protein